MMRRLLLLPLILSTSIAFAITIGDMEHHKEKSETKGIPKEVHVAKIKKVNEFMVKIEDNVLYTEKSKYNLRGVTVVNLIRGKNISTGKKKVVELIFVNERLREIVIHP